VHGGPVARILEAFPALQSWRARMAAFGHGTQEKLDSGAAISIAEEATAEKSSGNLDSHAVAIGEQVVAAATDTGTDPIEGTLYGATKSRFSIAREDSRAGRIVVHFPRLGFELRRVKKPA
jgi:hypothetical protein